MKRDGRSARARPMTIVNGILPLAVLIVVLQLWLFTASVNAYLGGDTAIALPSAAVSLLCLALNVGLLRYLRRLE